MELVSGTWSVVVVYALRDGPRRFTDLSDVIGGISNKVLTQTLRRLQANGVVSRHPEPGGAVRYAVTPLGQTLLAPVSALAQWAHDNALAVADAQDGAAAAVGTSR